jgi:hypothetical protein
VKVRALMEKLAKASPDAEVHLSVIVERDGEVEWSKSGALNTVWIFDNGTVGLDERAALDGESD